MTIDDNEDSIDKHHKTIMYDTYKTDIRFKNNKQYTALWEFLDFWFDKATKKGFLLNIQTIFTSAYDFCIHKEIRVDAIPPLYQEVFNVRSDVMSMVEIPYYMRDIWLQFFPSEDAIDAYKIKHNDVNVLHEFVEYLEGTKNMYGHEDTINHVRNYVDNISL